MEPDNSSLYEKSRIHAYLNGQKITYKTEKQWRCRSRKRFIKLLMGQGMTKRKAEITANAARQRYHSSPYFQAWRTYLCNSRFMSKTDMVFLLSGFEAFGAPYTPDEKETVDKDVRNWWVRSYNPNWPYPSPYSMRRFP